MKRFRGALWAFVVLAAVAVVVWLVDARFGGGDVPEEPQPALFRFEKEDLVGIRVQRPDVTIDLVREDGTWRMIGQPWKPSRSMVRRVAHQLHDLDARARVVDDVRDPALYGLGEDAIEVELSLADGEAIRFRAGDPNPTSVSYYIQPLPGDAVYVVKKSAVDYYRLDLEQFREHRFASLDADDADAIDAEVDGRRLSLHRVGPKQWRMTEPVQWDAAREEVRTMLGRTGALKASSFPADQPEDLSPWGMDFPHAEVRIGLSSGEIITLLVGDRVPDTDPQERYVYRVEHEAVYTAREGFLEAFTLPLEQYRRRDVVGLHEWDLMAMTVVRGSESISLTRTSDGWRWPDEAPVPGSTPRRLAARAADLEALGFHDDPPPASRTGLDRPYAVISLVVEEDGSERTVTLGGPVPEGDLPPATEDGREVEERRYALVGGDPVVYEVDDNLADVVDDLFREYGRKLDRDAEKGIDDALERELAEEPPVPPLHPPVIEEVEEAP